MAKATLDTKQWAKFFKKTRGRLSRRAELLRKSYAIVGFKDVDDHFRKEQGPDGRWKRRKPSTNKQYDQIRRSKRPRKSKTPRRSFNSSNKVLSLTGDMRQANLPRNSKLQGREAILVFNNQKYSGRHNRGDDDMPKRQFLWLSNKGKRLMLKIITSDIFK